MTNININIHTDICLKTLLLKLQLLCVYRQKHFITWRTKYDNSSRLAKLSMTLGLVWSISHVKIPYILAFLVRSKTSSNLCTENQSLIKALISFENSDHFWWENETRKYSQRWLKQVLEREHPWWKTERENSVNYKSLKIRALRLK